MTMWSNGPALVVLLLLSLLVSTSLPSASGQIHMSLYSDRTCSTPVPESVSALANYTTSLMAALPPSAVYWFPEQCVNLTDSSSASILAGPGGHSGIFSCVNDTYAWGRIWFNQSSCAGAFGLVDSPDENTLEFHMLLDGLWSTPPTPNCAVVNVWRTNEYDIVLPPSIGAMGGFFTCNSSNPLPPPGAFPTAIPAPSPTPADSTASNDASRLTLTAGMRSGWVLSALATASIAALLLSLD